MNLDFRMHAERTPNPDSIKWVLGQAVTGDDPSAAFDERVGEDVSPLAAGLLGIDGVASVFLGPTFITVTRAEGREWTELAAPIVDVIKIWAGSGESALGPAFERPEIRSDDEIVTRIREILDRDVRPYVAQDGGEISFAGFKDGVVEVYLRGACAGCPSSAITLKVGIESRLKEEFPEIKSVVAL